MIHVRSAAVALALLAGSLPAWSQDQETLKANLEKKLASDFVKKAKWITDFDEAKAEAKKANKLIFAYFTRSYAN